MCLVGMRCTRQRCYRPEMIKPRHSFIQDTVTHTSMPSKEITVSWLESFCSFISSRSIIAYLCEGTNINKGTR